MEQVKTVFEASWLWRVLNAICGWCGAQWERSAVVRWFLHPAQWLKSASESSIFYRLWSGIRSGLSRLYEKLHMERLFAGSVFLQPWLWCAGTVALAALIPTMAAGGLAVLTFCSLLLVLVRRRERELTFSPMNKYILLFMGAYLAAVAMSVTPRESLQPGVLFLIFVGFALITENSLLNRKNLERFTALLVLAATVVALIGVGQYIFGVSGAASWVDSNMFSTITTRVYSTLQNPNVLAEYLVMVLPLGGALLLSAKDWPRRILWLVCCGLMTLALLLTFSRGGWLGALIAGGIFVLLLKPRLILLAPVVLAVMFMVLPETVTSRFTSIGNLKDSSTSYRVSIWMGTIAMLKDFWLSGVGPGVDAFNRVYPAYCYHGATAQHSHNLILQLLCDGGICVLVLFLLIIFAYSRHICTAISKQKDWRNKLFPLASLCGVMGFLAQGMTDHPFYNYRVTLVFFAMLGLGAAWARVTAEEAEAK